MNSEPASNMLSANAKHGNPQKLNLAARLDPYYRTAMLIFMLVELLLLAWIAYRA